MLDTARATVPMQCVDHSLVTEVWTKEFETPFVAEASRGRSGPDQRAPINVFETWAERYAASHGLSIVAAENFDWWSGPSYKSLFVQAEVTVFRDPNRRGVP